MLRASEGEEQYRRQDFDDEARYDQEVWRPKDASDINRLVHQLCDRFHRRDDSRRYEADDLRILSVLEEAVLNAWIHGNKRDPSKAIIVRWRCDQNYDFEVIDTGPGFDCQSVPDPTQAENICRPAGRGIFIMRYYSDFIEWDNGGRRVRFSIRK